MYGGGGASGQGHGPQQQGHTAATSSQEAQLESRSGQVLLLSSFFRSQQLLGAALHPTAHSWPGPHAALVLAGWAHRPSHTFSGSSSSTLLFLCLQVVFWLRGLIVSFLQLVARNGLSFCGP